MESLREWIAEPFAERKVEPNSALGKALSYMQRHWEGLVRFFFFFCTPLDSNVVERALELVVLHRKSALFFKTEHGAFIGDILMSVVETCRQNQINVWEYLLALVRHARQVRKTPAKWLPWNFSAQGSQRRAA